MALCRQCRSRAVAPGDEYPAYAKARLCERCGCDRTIEEDARAELRAAGACENRHCERADPSRPERASNRVTVTWPKSAARANAPLRLCAACAAAHAQSFIGFGWSVSVDRITATGKARR